METFGSRHAAVGCVGDTTVAGGDNGSRVGYVRFDGERAAPTASECIGEDFPYLAIALAGKRVLEIAVDSLGILEVDSVGYLAQARPVFPDGLARSPRKAFP